MIIDFHAHIYPEKIAEKATAAVGTFYGDAPMAWHGRAQELIESGSRIGVKKYIVHSVATKAEQVESINNFIISACENFLSLLVLQLCIRIMKTLMQNLNEFMQQGFVV